MKFQVWVVHTSDGKRNKEIGLRTGKAKAVMREFCRSMLQNGSFQTRQICDF